MVFLSWLQISELKTQHEKSLNEQEQQHSDNLKRLQQEQEQRVSGECLD